MHEVLLVEDNPHDSLFTVEAFAEVGAAVQVKVVKDGLEALQYLRQEGRFADSKRPDLILLDLNLPKKDGRAVLAEIKGDEKLAVIPVVVLTTSKAEVDINTVYRLHGNCYVVKPIDFTRFVDIAGALVKFWFGTATLPN